MVARVCEWLLTDGARMSVSYYKRYRMMVDLARAPAPRELPPGYYWVPWHPDLVDMHGQVKARCFRDELDSVIFPCLKDRSGCEALMRDISSRMGFVPEATWLVGSERGYVGTVQGVVDGYAIGMIQNLGVVPEARGLGIGTCLLLQALEGFRSFGLHQGMLEVTAQNIRAVKLYRRLGFRRARTLYKAVETY